MIFIKAAIFKLLYNLFFFLFSWRYNPLGRSFTAKLRALASSFSRFLDHTRRATMGRTPLDEWSIRRRDLYLTTHSTHNRQTSTTDKHPFPRWDSNPQSQQASGRWDRQELCTIRWNFKRRCRRIWSFQLIFFFVQGYSERVQLF